MLQLHFSFSNEVLCIVLCKKCFSFSFGKYLMLQLYFSVVLVTFKVNHYINFYNVLSTMICCYCQFIQSGMQSLFYSASIK